MKVTGIVAEYNPFHNGHLYQLRKTKQLTKCDFTIAVMSGNFAQRGIPSAADKYTRTKMALSSGIDMVLELPFPFATSSAERFCEAAVSLLNKTNLVDSISFGSELGETGYLTEIARLLLNEPPSVSQAIQAELKKGISYPRARVKAISDFLQATTQHHTVNFSDILSSPNNILGVHYIKALLKYNSQIKPLTLKRKTAAYHDEILHGHIASATAIRKNISSQNISSIGSTMPEEAYTLLLNALQEHTHFPGLEDYSEFLQYKLSFSDINHLYTLWDIPHDLLNSILHASKEHFNILDIVSTVSSKTYTRATVQRAILRILLDLETTIMNELLTVDWVPYIRVLGCKKSATPLLSKLTHTSTIPIVTNLSRQYASLDDLSKKLLDLECRATKLYYLAARKPTFCNQDLTAPFIIL